MMEDYKELESVMRALPEGDPLLHNLGKKFMSVGMAEAAVASFIKIGNIKEAIDCCIGLNKWDIGVELAENHDMKQIETLISKFAAHLLQNGKIVHAIDLYRKSHHNSEAAKLLFNLSKEASKSGNLLRAKKLCVLAALQVEQHRKQFLYNKKDKTGSTPTQNRKKNTLDDLIDDDHTVGRQKEMAHSWKGAEAYHFLLLCQKQFYNGNIDAAMKTVSFVNLENFLLDIRHYD
jgi:WD repeat-containing protein 35